MTAKKEMKKSIIFITLVLLAIALVISGIVALETLDYTVLIIFLVFAIVVIALLLTIMASSEKKNSITAPADLAINRAYSSLKNKNVSGALKHYSNLRIHFNKHHSKMHPEDKKRLHGRGMKLYGEIFKASH